MNENTGIFNIDTLAQRTGLTRRTVRYYVQRGLLEPPQGGGRGSYYTEEHLRRLERIRAWAEQGVPLLHMKAMLDRGIGPAGEPAAEALADTPVLGATATPRVKGATPEQVASAKPLAGSRVPYERLVLADGVELHVRHGALPPQGLSPERLERVRQLLMDQEVK